MGKRKSSQKSNQKKPDRILGKKKLSSSGIGTQNESTIHAQLKKKYCRPESKTEEPVGNYLVDIAVNDGEIIEIQTRGFVKLRKKLDFLLQTHRVTLVYPLTVEKQLVFVRPGSREVVSRRRSPKKGSLLDAAWELTGIAEVLSHPSLTIEIILTRENEIRCRDGKGSWRRNGTSIVDRELAEVLGTVRLNTPLEYLQAFLPKGAPEHFTNRALSEYMEIPMHKAQEVTYCLRRLGVLEITSKKGRTYVFQVKNFRFVPSHK